MRSELHLWQVLTAVVLSIAMIATSSGCITPTGCASGRCRPIDWSGAPLPDDVRRDISSITVVPTHSAPTGTYLTYAKGRGEGFAKGMENGAEKGAKGTLKAGGDIIWVGVQSLPEAKPVGAIIGIMVMAVGLAVVVATPVVAIVGGIGGGVGGSVMAVSEDAAKKIDDTVTVTASDSSIQDRLSQQLVQTGEDRTYGQIAFLKMPVPTTEDISPPYHSLGLPEKRMIIEIGLNRLSFLGGRGSDPLIELQLEAQANAFRTSDGQLRRYEVISYTSVPRRASAWFAQDASLIKQEMAGAYKMIAEDLVDTLFLVTDLGFNYALSSPSGREYCIMKGYTPLNAGSLRPILQWQPLTRALREDEPDADISSRIGNVTYDLMIWKISGVPSEKRVYERRGITPVEKAVKVTEAVTVASPLDSSHTDTFVSEFEAEAATHILEEDLEPSSEYYWSVRARYTLDGRTYITRWSRLGKPDGASKTADCSRGTNNLDLYYRFITPTVGSLQKIETTHDESHK